MQQPKSQIHRKSQTTKHTTKQKNKPTTTKTKKVANKQQNTPKKPTQRTKLKQIPTLRNKRQSPLSIPTPSPNPKKKKTIPQGEYQVERILNKRINACGATEYQIKWQGYPLEESTWEPIGNLGNCRHLIDQFEKLEGILEMIEDEDLPDRSQNNNQTQRKTRVILDDDE